MSTHTSSNPPGLSLRSIIKDFTFFFCNELTACLNSLYVFLSNEVICTYPILSSLTSLFTLATTISSLFTVTSNCLSPLFIVKTTDVPAFPLISEGFPWTYSFPAHRNILWQLHTSSVFSRYIVVWVHA